MGVAFRKALRRAAFNQRQQQGRVSTAMRWVGVVAAAGAGTYGFGLAIHTVLRGADPTAVENLLQWSSVALVAGATLDVHGSVLRDPQRRILDLLPMDPAEVVPVLAQRALMRWMGIGIGLSAALWPLMQLGPWTWASASLLLIGTAAFAVVAAVIALFQAAAIAEHPGWASTLDALRGVNPRAQAAFLYAPGVVLLSVGAVAFAIAAMFRHWIETPQLFALSLIPFILSGAAYRWLPGLARSRYYDAGRILSDIDARYAAAQVAERGRPVYLEGAVRYAPKRLQPWLRDELRRGWRAHRTWITLTALGAMGLAILTGRQGIPLGFGVLLLACGVFGTMAFALDNEEPRFLKTWWVRPSLTRMLAMWGWGWPLPVGFGVGAMWNGSLWWLPSLLGMVWLIIGVSAGVIASRIDYGRWVYALGMAWIGTALWLIGATS